MSVSGDSISGSSISGDGGAATPTAPIDAQWIVQRCAAAIYWELEMVLPHHYVFMSPFIPIQPVAPGTIGTTRVDIDRWEEEDAFAPLRTRRRPTFTAPFVNPQQTIPFMINT